MKKLCSQDGCFEKVDYEPEFGDVVIRTDGTFHPLSLKCWDCRTDEDRKKLKEYRKRLRKKANKKLN